MVFPVPSWPLSHPVQPLPLVTVITWGPPSLSQWAHMLFCPPASVQTMCVSLGYPKNRTWGKGLCARTLFRRMVPGREVRRQETEGGESTRGSFPKEATGHWISWSLFLGWRGRLMLYSCEFGKEAENNDMGQGWRNTGNTIRREYHLGLKGQYQLL